MAKSPEIAYYIRVLDAHRTSVSKEVDGEFEKVYNQDSIADCNCPGAIHHRTQCKHMLIRIAWEGLGRPAGMYFTIDKARQVHAHKSPTQED